MWLCQNASFDTTTFVSFVMIKKTRQLEILPQRMHSNWLKTFILYNSQQTQLMMLFSFLTKTFIIGQCLLYIVKCIQKYNQEIEESKRGDFIPFALSYFNKQLESLGQELYYLTQKMTLITYWWLIKKMPKNKSL